MLKFTANTKDFLKVLKKFKGMVRKKDNILGYVHLQAAKGGQISVESTDLRVSHSVTIGADVSVFGSVAVHHKQLSAILSNIKAEKFTLSVAVNLKAVITDQKRIYTLLGAGTEEWPTAYTLGDVRGAFVLAKKSLKDMFEVVKCAAYQKYKSGYGRFDYSQHPINLVCRINSIGLTGISDKILSRSSRGLKEKGADVDALLPGDGVKQTLLVDSNEISVKDFKNHIIFETTSEKVLVQKLAKDCFPSINSVNSLLTTPELMPSISVIELLRACRDAHFITKESNSKAIGLRVEDNRLKIRAEQPVQQLAYQTTVPIITKKTNRNAKISFNFNNDDLIKVLSTLQEPCFIVLEKDKPSIFMSRDSDLIYDQHVLMCLLDD